MRILLTGAAGTIATALRPRLAERGYDLALMDIDEVSELQPNETALRASVLDRADLERAMLDVDVVVHLAAAPRERDWDTIVSLNITGARNVLEAALAAGVRRVLVASSIHAVGSLTYGESRTQFQPQARPDTYYGFSKAAVEALAQMYASREPAALIVAARIGTFRERPLEARDLVTWLSPVDFARLIDRVACAPAPGFHIVWAVSNNTHGVVRHDAGVPIGFIPRDNADDYSETVAELPDLSDDTPLGDRWVSHPLGQPLD